MHRLKFLFGIAAVLAVCQQTSAQPAFPGAQGGGASSKGGRGGVVIEVNTLADSGPGSLRACIDASGPRTCVFRVGGTIQLSKSLAINNPFITIAGQTAPGGGILLSGKNMIHTPLISGDEYLIIRYLRIRKGFNASCLDECGAGFFGYSPSKTYILDHLSVSWNQDEGIANYSHSPAQFNITNQWNIMSEGLHPHATGGFTGAGTASISAVNGRGDR